MTEPTVDSELDRLIQVTPEMVMAGLEAINPRLIERDPERAVTEIYRAMEKAKYPPKERTMFNRRVLLTSAAILPLAACASTDKLPPDVLAFVTKVQAIVVKGCGFLPAVEGVLALIGGAIPAVATVEVVADWICRAIPPAAGLAPRAGQTVTLTVQGKPVAGVFVR